MATPQALVLVVDDDPLVRDAMTLDLTMQGFKVTSAADGQEALDLMRVQRPSVVVLDLEMPGVDGWSFRERQLQDARLASVPVVVVSGYTDAERQARALNAARGLQKPVDLDELHEAISTFCA
jgi:CheY-like chemotaxis protein